MADPSIQSLIDELDDLLEKEREGLIAGQVEDVWRLHARKENLIEALARGDARERVELGPVRAKVDRNQVLLESALEGVRSVARRLAMIRRVRQCLDTYDARGRKTSVDVRKSGSLERRA